MQHITSTSGLSAQAPVPSVTKKTTITRLDGCQKNLAKSSTAVQITLKKHYIIYIMENKNSKINNSLTHIK